MEFTGERFIPDLELDSEIAIEHYQRYHSIIDIIKDKVVLDAACGEGYGSNILSKYAHKVYGIDISSETILHAKQTYQKENLEFYNYSVVDFDLEDDSIDVVVSYETIEHISGEEQVAFLREIKRVLKRDGILIISTPDKYIYSDLHNYKNEYHVKEFYRSEFNKFLSNYFSHIYFYNQGFQVTSVLSSAAIVEVRSLSIIKFDDKGQNKDGKYIIAICSNQELDLKDSIDSIILDNANKYNNLVDRIIQLQDEVEDKNRHIRILQQEIKAKEEYIDQNDERTNEFIEGLQTIQTHLSEECKDEVIDNKEKLLNNQMLIMNDLENLKKSLIAMNRISSSTKSKDEIILTKDQRIEKLVNVNMNMLLKLRERDRKIEIKKNKIKKLITIISDILSKLKNANELIDAKDKDIDGLKRAKDREINELVKIRADLQAELKEASQTILNQKGHIELLLEQERKLMRIYESNGWKFLLRYYRLRDSILPVNSKRRLFVKLVGKVLRTPGLAIKLLSFKNIKKFFIKIKNEDAEVISQKIDRLIEQQQENKIDLKLFIDQKIKEKLSFNLVQDPLVSIIIPVYNQWDFTYSCLKSILENSKGITYEIIVADDVSQDDTKDIKNYVENINIVRNETNLGFLLNCNNAAKRVRGKYIVFLNNDTNVQSDWLKYLIDLIESDKNIGMVGSKLVYQNGKLQEAGGIIWRDASGWNYGRMDDPTKPEYNYVKEVDYISGASIMIKKELWEEIGGFDQRYVPAYFEDADLAFEVRKHGYKVVYQPKSVVVHFEGISHGRDINSSIKRYQVENREKFIEKWKDILERDHYENGSNVLHARDRSKGKKIIMVVDHYVPHFDSDAGSKCTYHYIKLFKEMGMNVIFLGDNFYPHQPYTDILQQMGIDVLYGNWYYNNYRAWLKENAKYLDYVYLNRPHISIKYIDLIKEYSSAKVIYFGHDLHYLRELRNYEIGGDPKLLESSNKWKEVETELFNKADTVYAVGSYEQQTIKNMFPDKLVRNIPVYIYSKVNDKVINEFENRKDIMFVGGFAHKPNIDAAIWFTEKILPLIKKTLPQLKFYIIGSKPTEEIMKLANEDVIVTGFVSDEELERYYINCRVVVAPLTYGAGVKGKVVEAIYNRIPIVTTPIGAEGLSEIDKYALISQREDEFANNVIRLYSDKEKWDELSNSYDSYIEKYFSRETAMRILREDFMQGK